MPVAPELVTVGADAVSSPVADRLKDRVPLLLAADLDTDALIVSSTDADIVSLVKFDEGDPVADAPLGLTDANLERDREVVASLRVMVAVADVLLPRSTVCVSVPDAVASSDSERVWDGADRDSVHDAVTSPVGENVELRPARLDDDCDSDEVASALSDADFDSSDVAVVTAAVVLAGSDASKNSTPNTSTNAGLRRLRCRSGPGGREELMW